MNLLAPPNKISSESERRPEQVGTTRLSVIWAEEEATTERGLQGGLVAR